MFASTPFLLLEMDPTALLKRPVEYSSHHDVGGAKANQRTGSAEVRSFGFEVTVEFTPRTPTLLTNALWGNKPKFDASGLVGEGESTPFQVNSVPNHVPSRPGQSSSPTFESGQAVSLANNLQLSVELSTRIEPAPLFAKPEFALSRGRDSGTAGTLLNDQPLASIDEAKQP
ncbi:MAG: hypothetical protein MUC83_19205, partial [Pirellula sp.]|nr:hypothetical protein [Pirellula sp.]